MTCGLCRTIDGQRGQCVFQQSTAAGAAERDTMREYRLRVYDDHYLVTDMAVGVGTEVVELGKLEEKIHVPQADPNPGKVLPKKSRRKRGPNKPKVETQEEAAG